MKWTVIKATLANFPERDLSKMRVCYRVAFFSLCITASVLVYLFLLSVTSRSGLTWVAAAVLAGACLWVNALFFRQQSRSLGSIGLEWGRGQMMSRLGAGFLMGGLLIVGWNIVVFMITGAPERFWIKPWESGALNLLVFYLFNNLGEELAYRGFAFVLLEDAFGRVITILATSIVFMLLHVQGGMPWPNAVVGVFTTSLVFGVLFSISKSLPFALGTHFAMNVFQDISGLRATSLSLVDFNNSASSATKAQEILLGVGLLNLAFFAVALFLGRKQKAFSRT